jgi:predicted ATP-grasp superfamily ATP-dependent carboligase
MVKPGEIPAVVIGDLLLLHCFLGTGIPIISVPRSDDDVTRYSRLFRPSGLTIQDLQNRGEIFFLEKLLDISQHAGNRPVLFFGDDQILSFVMRHRDILQRHFRMTLPSSEMLLACGEKGHFNDLAVSHNLPVPRGINGTVDLCSQQVAREIGFPCVFKPSSHVGWHQAVSEQTEDRMPRKVLVADNIDTCATALSRMREFSDEFVIQECIEGGEDEIYSFHTYRPASGPGSAFFVGQKIRTYPSANGESTFLKLVHNAEVHRMGLEIVRMLDIRGPVKIDFKRDPGRDNKFYLLEVNLRFTLWNYLGASCGVNLPLLAYQDACSLPQKLPHTYRTDINWLHFENDARTFFKDYLPSGQLSVFAWITTLMQPKVCAIFAWQDPLPFFVQASRSVLRVTKQLSRRVLS